MSAISWRREEGGNNKTASTSVTTAPRTRMHRPDPWPKGNYNTGKSLQILLKMAGVTVDRNNSVLLASERNRRKTSGPSTTIPTRARLRGCPRSVSCTKSSFCYLGVPQTARPNNSNAIFRTAQYSTASTSLRRSKRGISHHWT